MTGFRDIQRARFALSQTSQRILVENSMRCFAYIANNTGSSIWVSFKNPAIKDQDITIKPNERYEITSHNLWIGDVHFVAGVNQASQFIEVVEGY